MHIQESTHRFPEADEELDVPLFGEEPGAAEVSCARSRALSVILTDNEPLPPQSEPACDSDC
jgi:hypothetical protein